LFLPCKVKDFLENNKHFSKKNKKNSEFLGMKANFLRLLSAYESVLTLTDTPLCAVGAQENILHFSWMFQK